MLKIFAGYHNNRLWKNCHLNPCNCALRSPWLFPQMASVYPLLTFKLLLWIYLIYRGLSLDLSVPLVPLLSTKRWQSAEVAQPWPVPRYPVELLIVFYEKWKLLILFVFVFLERGRETERQRDRERERHRLVASYTRTNWGLNLNCRYGTGTEHSTLCCTGRCWATPARAKTLNFCHYFWL